MTSTKTANVNHLNRILAYIEAINTPVNITKIRIDCSLDIEYIKTALLFLVHNKLVNKKKFRGDHTIFYSRRKWK